MSKTNSTILDEAKKLVLGPRRAKYGHPIKDFTRIARMWSVILDIEVKPEQVGLCMIALKISRECNLHKRDNLVDIGGYALCADLVSDRKDNNE